jgi:hypothetical protein
MLRLGDEKSGVRLGAIISAMNNEDAVTTSLRTGGTGTLRHRQSACLPVSTEWSIGHIRRLRTITA